MTMARRDQHPSDVAIIGGGFSGVLFALKLAEARPSATITLIERDRRLGVGLAYGRCGPDHRLNVPVARMETGLRPSFQDWLGEGWNAGDFAPRALFGAYVESLAARAVAAGRIRRLRGEAVAVSHAGRPQVILADGRTLAADLVALALGNLPPDAPGGLPRRVTDSDRFVADPWAPGALADTPPDAPVLVIGAGLTMIDVVLALEAQGHRGPVTALSRRGLVPLGHAAGGAWPAFLEPHVGAGPRQLARILRREVRAAAAAGVPWQRVFDAARPAVPAIWSAWTTDERRLFMTRLRPWWDIHRHRTAPRVTQAVEGLRASGRLAVIAGKTVAADLGEDGVTVTVRRRGQEQVVRAVRVINCTGPGGRFDKTAHPLIAQMRAAGLARADVFGLGFDTRDGFVVQADGVPCPWLLGLGPMARAAWWEVTAVPEIVAQVDRLTARVAAGSGPDMAADPIFLHAGAGI